MAASLVGTMYHLVKTLRLASIREELKIPLKDLEKDLCQSSKSQTSWRSSSYASIYGSLAVRLASDE